VSSLISRGVAREQVVVAINSGGLDRLLEVVKA
jgi:hypothetical protein